MTDEAPRSWTVRHDERRLRFTGVRLAAASSHEEGKQRWIELALYRTTGGSFIVERIGRSVVKKSPKTGKPEKDFFFAQVCETPRAVLETLYARDEDGAWFLSNIARNLLEEAGELDESIGAAYRTEYIK